MRKNQKRNITTFPLLGILTHEHKLTRQIRILIWFCTKRETSVILKNSISLRMKKVSRCWALSSTNYYWGCHWHEHEHYSCSRHCHGCQNYTEKLFIWAQNCFGRTHAEQFLYISNIKYNTGSTPGGSKKIWQCFDLTMNILLHLNSRFNSSQSIAYKSAKTFI